MQYYAEVLEYAPPSLFQPRFGLFLRDDIHHSFDRGHIALYPLVSDALGGSILYDFIADYH
jgi:hypothetical protein